MYRIGKLFTSQYKNYSSSVLSPNPPHDLFTLDLNTNSDDRYIFKINKRANCASNIRSESRIYYIRYILFYVFLYHIIVHVTAPLCLIIILSFMR